MERHSYFLFGGSLFTKLGPLLREQGHVCGQRTGISPVSEISLSARADSEGLSCWLPELEAELSGCGAEYFVLDLQLALQNLLVSGGRYISASAGNLARLTRREIAVVDPVLLPRETVDDALGRLATAVTKHFSPKHIILIHTNNSPYWLAGSNLRAEGAVTVDARHAAWLCALEQRFCRITGCHFVDVTRFYFCQKEEGRPLTNVVYEKECYLDIADRIACVAAGGDARAERPNFAYSLDRYAAYYFTLQRKPQRIFLNADYFLDRLVLCADGEFVRRYREELIKLDALCWHEPGKALKTLNRMNPESVAAKVCTAFHAVMNGNYTEPGVDYALMFRSGVVPDVVLAYLKAEYARNAGVLPVQITRNNAGYHFARMLGVDPGPFSTGKTVAKPRVVDIFGSCISRTVFNVRDDDFAVNRSWFHVVPFEHRNKPAKYPSALFSPPVSWVDRLVKRQLDCRIYQDILQSDGEWLVIDLFFLISPNNFYYQDCLFGDFNHRIGNGLKAKRVDLFRDPGLFGSREALLHAMDPWLDIIRKKYGKKIILIEGQRLRYWIGDDDRIYMLKNTHDCNGYLKQAAEYVQSKTDCYQISIDRFFLPDELGYMRNTPTHREDLGYFAVHDIVRHIVDKEPCQKVFTQYAGETHMRHLERLARRNSPAVLNEALPLSELDRAVVKLGYERMCHWHYELAEVYDRSSWPLPLEDVIASYISDPALARELREAARLPLDGPATIRHDYSGYPEAAQIVGGSCGSCCLPALPMVSVKRIVNDRGFVTVKWNAPPETWVRIYRKAEGSPWTLVGRSAQGEFCDKTAAPLTGYRYCLCVEAEGEARCYLANFTEPVEIHTAPATPVLISAVHFGGENTLLWEAVAGAESYRIYRKDAVDQRWTLCATVSAGGDTCYREKSKFSAGGEWYTVRAVRTVNGTASAGGFQRGLCAAPL